LPSISAGGTAATCTAVVPITRLVPHPEQEARAIRAACASTTCCAVGAHRTVDTIPSDQFKVCHVRVYLISFNYAVTSGTSAKGDRCTAPGRQRGSPDYPQAARCFRHPL
jgi:hypothetical protein